LDEANEHIVLDLLHRLHDEGSTIIVTHSPEVADHADRTIMLEHGKITRTQRAVAAG
jgi:putative ABC transport system ATP-binding protein